MRKARVLPDPVSDCRMRSSRSSSTRLALFCTSAIPSPAPPHLLYTPPADAVYSPPRCTLYRLGVLCTPSSRCAVSSSCVRFLPPCPMCSVPPRRALYLPPRSTLYLLRVLCTSLLTVLFTSLSPCSVLHSWVCSVPPSSFVLYLRPRSALYLLLQNAPYPGGVGELPTSAADILPSFLFDKVHEVGPKSVMGSFPAPVTV